MRYRPLGSDRMVPFTCLGSDCPKTCCGPFEGTRALQSVLSVEDLGRSLDDEADPAQSISIFAQIRLTPEDVDRLREAGLDHLMVYRGDPADPHYYLRLQPDGSCAALSATHMCSIHPHRPTICRAFPFYLDLFAGLCMVEACPGVGAGEQPLENLREETRAALKMYTFWVNVLLAEDEPAE